MIKIKKINKEIVKPVKLPTHDPKDILGGQIFPNLNSNIFLLAKKQSGKTCTIFHILQKCVNKNTTVYIFASTVFNDPTWLEIVKWLKKKKIPYKRFTSIFNDEGQNIVTDLVNELTNKQKQKANDEEDENNNNYDDWLMFDSDEEEEEEKEKKPKKIAPEYFLIFDDLSDELSNKSIPTLVKKNRHFTMKMLFSSQYYHDLSKPARTNLDYILLYPHIPEEKLELLHKESDMATSYPIFQKLYNHATKENYNFLYCDLRKHKFRKNLNSEYEIPEN